MTDFTVTEQRSEVITFSTPLDQVYHAIIIQNPINAYNYEAYTSPLTTITWLMFLVWIIATPPILFIVSRCFPLFMLNELGETNCIICSNFRYGELDKNINELTFTKAYVMVSGTFTQRGFSHAPSTWKARIAFTR